MLFRYEELTVSDLALELIGNVYDCTEKFPHKEQFILSSQLIRSTNSILLNIAEGSARNSKKDFARFLNISLGSLMETHANLKIALQRNYIKNHEYTILHNDIQTLWFKLIALRNSQFKKSTQKSTNEAQAT